MSYQAVPYTHCTAVTVKGTHFGTADCSQHPHTSTPGGAPLVLPIPSSPTVCPSQPGVGPMQCQSGQAWHSIRHSARAISALSSTRVFALHCLNFGVELRETKITPCRIVVQRVAINVSQGLFQSLKLSTWASRVQMLCHHSRLSSSLLK